MILPGLLSFLALLPVVPPALGSGAQDTKPTADDLINEAWLLLPAYTGEHRAFLEEEEASETLAAAHLLRAGLALNPDHVRGLWSLGHAEILLAEDQKNRSLAGEEHYRAAVDALTGAIERQPDDPWAYYARGAAHTSFGFHWLALKDLDAAVETANLQLENGVGSSPEWLRFKSLEWRTEVLMRMGEHGRAREALRAFHGEFSNNEWPLFIALAESHLRERDFAGARERYDEALAGFPSDHQAYALLGYLAGLLGDKETASRRLLEALEYELRPDLYTRMWLWILATDEHLAAAEEDLRGFLQNPPDDLSAWDRELGAFVVGGTPVADFLALAQAEAERRMAAGEALDDLMCEASFYAGLRQELDAAAAEDDGERASLRLSALEAYGEALRYRPAKWKWEWAYARLHFAGLCSELRLPRSLALTLEQDGTLSPDGNGVLSKVSWHRPLSPRATASLDERRPGDLLLGILQTEHEAKRPILEVIGFQDGE